jgi:preprotein translocase subunit SecB
MNNIDIQNAIRLVKVQFPQFDVTSSDFINGDTMTDEIDIKIEYNILFSETNSKRFIVEFKAKLSNKEANFKANFLMIALFEAQNEIDDDFKNSSFIKVNAPAIAFPFLRSFITTVSVNAGFKPIIVPSINLTNGK